MKHKIKQVTLIDGEIKAKRWKFLCPGCNQWGFIDDDQLNGRVSLDCPNCEFHETVNLIKEADNIT